MSNGGPNKKLSELEGDISGAKGSVSGLARDLDDLIRNSRNLTDEVIAWTREIYGSSEASKELNKSIRDISRLTRGVATNWLDILDGNKKSRDIEKDIIKSQRARNVLTTEYNSLAKMGIDSQHLLSLDADGRKKQLQGMTHLSEAQKGLIGAMAGALNNHKDVTNELKKQLVFVKKSETFFVKALGSASTIMSKLGLGAFATPFKEAGDALFKANLNSLGFLATIKAVWSAVSKVVGPLLLIEAIMSGFTFDKEVTNLQKSLVLTEEAAKKVRHQFSRMQAEIGDSFINSKDLQESASKINELLGTAFLPVGQFKELSEEASILRERMGFSEESIAGFTRSAASSGESMLEMIDNGNSYINTFQKSTGILINNKALFELNFGL